MRKRKSGSFTVEAALVIPIITFVIIILIHTILIMHDRGYAYMKLSEYAQTGADITDNVYKECNRRLFVSSIYDIEYESTFSECIIKGVIRTNSRIFKDRPVTVRRYAPDYCRYIRSQNIILNQKQQK